jgi:hypothetical protein
MFLHVYQMRILSIDVGIKNLAFCLLENEKIAKWDVVNLAAQDASDGCGCCVVDKNVKCSNLAKFIKNGDHYCLKHAKKQPFQIPTPELKKAFINKQKLQKLYEMADKFGIQYTNTMKKNDIIHELNEYTTNMCFEMVHSVGASEIDLVTIGKNIKKHFDQIFSGGEMFDYVIIENQISPIANRMKTIQGMIAQYFIMTGSCQKIEFVSSVNKLKDIAPADKSVKLTYGDRKKLGISKCLEIIKDTNSYSEWCDYFSSHKKKDDLADSFLQGRWFKNQLV